MSRSVKMFVDDDENTNRGRGRKHLNPSHEKQFERCAKQARRSVVNHKHGCVLVHPRSGAVVASGFNKPTHHAECDVIKKFPQPSTPSQTHHQPLSLPSLSSDSQSQTSMPFTKTVSVDTSTTNNSKKRGRRTKIQ
eukprot:4320684-Pyramimonas_sp.AAC.1